MAVLDDAVPHGTATAEGPTEVRIWRASLIASAARGREARGKVSAAAADAKPQARGFCGSFGSLRFLVASQNPAPRRGDFRAVNCQLRAAAATGSFPLWGAWEARSRPFSWKSIFLLKYNENPILVETLQK